MTDVADIKSVLLSVKNAILVSSIDSTEQVTLVFPTSTSETKEITCTEAEANLIASAIRVCVETMVKTRKKESHIRHIAKKVKHTLNSEYKQDTFDLDGKPYTFIESGSRHVGDYYMLDIDALGDIVNVQTPILKQFPHALSKELGVSELKSIAIGSKDSADPVAKFEYLMTAESFPEKYSDAEYDECQAFIRSIKEPEEIPSLEEIINKEFIKFNSEIEISEYSEITIDAQAQ